MEFFAFGYIVWVVLGISLAIAPLLLWRNTNRTNRLLALLLKQHGVEPRIIRNVFNQGGGKCPVKDNGSIVVHYDLIEPELGPDQK